MISPLQRPARLLLLHDRFTRVEFGLAGVALTALLGAYLFEVVSRYAFGAPTRWTSDLVQYMLCASVALALPLVAREGGHVAITSFIDKLRAGPRTRVARGIAWVGAAVLGGTTLLFAQVSLDQARQGIETVAAFAIPKWWLTGVVTLGLLDSTLHLLRQGVGWGPLQIGQELDL